MKQTNERTPRGSVAAGTAPQPDTLPAQGETQQGVPRMPHERDESASATQAPSEPSMKRMGRIAQADAERGLQDTTKGAELDATYDRLREDLLDGEKKFTP